MSENKLPQWAIDGLREAGLSAEVWEPTQGIDDEVIRRMNVLNTLGATDDNAMWIRADGSIHWTCGSRDNLALALSAPDAFLLAARLAAALENKPDPRVVELEAEVARLRGALDQIRQMDMGDCGDIAYRALSEATNE